MIGIGPHEQYPAVGDHASSATKERDRGRLLHPVRHPSHHHRLRHHQR